MRRFATFQEVIAKTAVATAEKIEQHPGGWALIIAKQMLYYFDRRDAPSFVAALGLALAPDGQLIVEVFNGALLSSRFTELKDPGNPHRLHRERPQAAA